MTLEAGGRYLEVGIRFPTEVSACVGPLLQPGRARDSPVPSRRPIAAENSPSTGPTGARRFVALTLATAGGAGFAPVAPGTFGSAVGVVLFVPLASLGAVVVLAVAAVLLAVGTWAADETERIYGKKDDGRIVMDEVVGQLVTLAPLAALGPTQGLEGALFVAAGFFVFRFFDIWKPGPARMAERRLPGGLGVMMDDVVAGAFSAAVIGVAALVYGASA